MHRLLWIVALAFVLYGQRAQAGELIMFESAGCEWCEVWDEEVGGVYAKTPEGRRAPLRRVDISDARPVDLRFIKNVVYTPTFVLVENGAEVGRIIGYPGEDFFWGYLGQMLGKLPKSDNIRIVWPAGPGSDPAPSVKGRDK